MQYQFVKILSNIVCFLAEAIRRLLGECLGQLCWLIVPAKRRHMAIDNIMLSLKVDKASATDIAKKSVTRFGDMFLAVLCFPKLSKTNIKKHVTLEGDEHLRQALSYGQGVVMATAHTGNWELLGAALAMNDFPIVGVAQKQTNAAMDKFINEYRTMTGIHVTYKSGVLEMVRLLGKGKIIALLMDQDAHQNGVFVDFFGRTASTPQGAAALARMKGSPIVPVFIKENPDKTHTVIFHPCVWVEKTSDREHDISITTQGLTKIVEDHIRTYPHEWFWLHNRWKTKRPQ